MSKNLLEVREYKFEHVILWAKLDRRNKKLSFVEWDDKINEYVPKEWMFAGRELKYMNGWLHILQAMQYVINDCKTVMESWNTEETDEMIKLLVALNEPDNEVNN